MDDAWRLDNRPVCQIRVKGSFGEAWSDWFDGLSIVSLENGETLLAGPVVDQAALYGILWKLRDLNLELISVDTIERDSVCRDPLNTKGEAQMASLTQTLKENVSTKTVLFISIAVIVAKWIAKAITNTIYVDATFARISSIQGIALMALKNGAFVVISATLLLVLSREKYGDLGFHGRRLLGQIGLGVLFGVLIFVLDTLLISPVASALVPETASQGVDMSVFFGKLSYVPIWLAIALLKGGLTEELWRIFGLTRFEKLFGRTGLVLALIASSLAFGLGHAYQGLGAVLAEGVQGLLYAGVYLRKRSAWEPVVAHAVFDLIGITLGFLIYA